MSWDLSCLDCFAWNFANGQTQHCLAKESWVGWTRWPRRGKDLGWKLSEAQGRWGGKGSEEGF